MLKLTVRAPSRLTLRVTVKTAAIVPLFPSVTLTSSIDSLAGGGGGGGTGGQDWSLIKTEALFPLALAVAASSQPSPSKSPAAKHWGPSRRRSCAGREGSVAAAGEHADGLVDPVGRSDVQVRVLVEVAQDNGGRLTAGAIVLRCRKAAAGLRPAAR